MLQKLPSAVGLGIALQMTDGSTRVLRMSEALEAHLRQEWTPYVLSSAADVRGEDVLRILLYQDKKQMPLVPLLDQALGGGSRSSAGGACRAGSDGVDSGCCFGDGNVQCGLPACWLCS